MEDLYVQIIDVMDGMRSNSKRGILDSKVKMLLAIGLERNGNLKLLCK